MGRSNTVTVTVSGINTVLTLTEYSGRTEFYQSQSFQLVATLKDSSGNAISGRTVKIYEIAPNATSGTLLTSGTTNTSGIFTYTVSCANKTPGQYTYYAVFEGDSTYNANQSSYYYIRILSEKVPTTITINVDKTSGVAPLSITISGSLTDSSGNPLPNKQVNIYENGVKIATVTTTNGYYSYTISRGAGSYTYQAEFPGDDYYAGCEEAENEQPPQEEEAW
jgi:hypothetical protein